MISSSAEIFRVLAEHDLFKLDHNDSEDLLSQFFELSRNQEQRDNIKSQIFKIIEKTRVLREHHLEYVVGELR